MGFAHLVAMYRELGEDVSTSAPSPKRRLLGVASTVAVATLALSGCGVDLQGLSDDALGGLDSEQDGKVKGKCDLTYTATATDTRSHSWTATNMDTNTATWSANTHSNTRSCTRTGTGTSTRTRTGKHRDRRS